MPRGVSVLSRNFLGPGAILDQPVASEGKGGGDPGPSGRGIDVVCPSAL